MQTSPIDQLPGHFVEIPRPMCEELLRGRTVGRVAWTGGEGPNILPVNYVFHDGQVVFRTTPYGPLSGLARRTAVAFEIDEIDEQARAGWNVVVTGYAEGVSQDYLLSRLWQDGPQPWASGSRTLIVAITPRTVSGRVVRG